jgi:type II secretory pathway pseudopilin PulG
LIELLVVIAIIALLIAILLPSLEAARRQAKQNACMSSIKNISTSSNVYEADDPSGWGIPVHPLQYKQCEGQGQGRECTSPTFIGAYEWGGKSGIGRNDFVQQFAGNKLGSKYGTRAGFGPATRPLNKIIFPGGFNNNYDPDKNYWNRPGAEADTELELDIFKCAGDDGPPRGVDGLGPHCADWIIQEMVSSYDFFGTSYAANLFMIGQQGGGEMYTNSPYLRPISRVPTPARTLYYEENIGRWAWSCKNEIPDCTWIGQGVEPGPTKAVRGWHGKDWTYNRAFVDAHAEYQKIVIEGTEDRNGYSYHYRNEKLSSYPAMGEGPVPTDEAGFEQYRCIIVRGDGWQKDTMPANLIETDLIAGGNGRPSYEDCVTTE